MSKRVLQDLFKPTTGKMMNQTILALLLLFGSYNAFAETPIVINANSPLVSHESNMFADWGRLGKEGEKGTEWFSELMNKSKTFALLVTLESAVPNQTRQLKYLALLSEVHQINQTLFQLLAALTSNNRLIEKSIHIGRAMDG
jgi:hypothetical protein